jgi:hypothetical protein
VPVVADGQRSRCKHMQNIPTVLQSKFHDSLHFEGTLRDGTDIFVCSSEADVKSSTTSS